MGRKATTQWDFGELFDPKSMRQIYSVSELTAQIRRLLEERIGRIWVTGEITNLRAQSSGHCYFTLKDAGAQLQCVVFRGDAVPHRELLKDGQKLILQGDLTVYEGRGQYQLRVLAIELQGMGALQVAFERLKQKLAAEGLFAPERKRPLPGFCQRIGLVTSPTGAAIRDIIHVIKRRQPNLEIILAPCCVQGSTAAGEIASAIGWLNRWSDPKAPSRKLDLVLVTRGGGSLEDLWPFNEEIVARAIFHSKLPVISAVGHEIDFTISDFVADFRAATPSAAAEIITEAGIARRQFLAETPGRLRQLIQQRMDWEQAECKRLGHRLARAHPRRRLREQLQRLDDFQAVLERCLKYQVRDCQTRWQTLHQRLQRVRPAQLLQRRRHYLEEWQQRLKTQVRLQFQSGQHRCAGLETRLKLLSPANVLERGYSITTDAASGKIIRAAEETRKGQRLKTRLKSGQVQSVVEEKTSEQ